MPEDLPDVYLKFDGLVGESMDDEHPGKDGWVTIKSFNFSFGLTGAAVDPNADHDPKAAGLTQAEIDSCKGDKAKLNALIAKKQQAKGGKGTHKKSQSMVSGPMTFEPITINKSSDIMSDKLMEKCWLGKEIKTVELVACRPGGLLGDKKLPFLRMTFSKVHIKSCKLNLATDGLPTEDLELSYKKVEMRCLWTSNTTGRKLEEEPTPAGWDLEKQKELDDYDALAP